MAHVTTNQLAGFYGNFSTQPKFIFHAIAIGRILEYRGERLPRHFNALVNRAKQLPDEGYARRKQLLTYFGIRTYQQYLRSELWYAVRKLAMTETSCRCRFCDQAANQVHHRSYDIATLAGATIEKLYPTCDRCHYSLEFDENDRKRTFPEVNAETKSRCPG